VKNFNYELHYTIAVFIYNKKLHLEKSGEKWDSNTLSLFTTGALKKFQQVQGSTLKERFQNTMLGEIEKRHAFGDSAGFETHPDYTPYDKLMLLMKMEMEEVKARSAYEKKKKKTQFVDASD
jgi:hypothetical protein